jgi:hypothetical protein
MSPTSYFFSDPDRVAALHAAIWELRDMTFAEGSRDCIRYGELVMAGAGLPETFDFQRTDADYKGHAHNTKILRYLRGEHEDPQSSILHARFVELTDKLDTLVPKATWPHGRVLTTGLMPGDIVIIKAMLRGVWHFGIMINDRTYTHCAYDIGVTQGDITEGHIRERLTAIFRARMVPQSATSS